MDETGKGFDRLIPTEGSHPYYIYSPPYNRRSAGVRTLHFLCHALNRTGQNAFVATDSHRSVYGPLVHPDLLTPLLSQEIVTYHYVRSRCPIVVYPEIVAGNPLGAPVVVRYVLNFPGLLGGDKTYAANEVCFGYSKELAVAAGVPDNVLFAPIADIRVFRPLRDVRRTLFSFYAKKYKAAYNNTTFRHPAGAIEINDELSPAEIADIFRRSILFYCYENSALALEAALCGCPVVFVPNEHLGKLIADSELGRDGFAWGDEVNEIEHAKLTVSSVFQNYRTLREGFYPQLSKFIKLTQQRAASTRYEAPLAAIALR